MKKSVISFALLLGLFFVFPACSGDTEIKLSPEMTEFTKMINGNSEDVVAAIGKFAADDNVKNSDMSMYKLSDPKVTAFTGDCFTTEFKAGSAVKTFDICWSAGKISSITEKGAE